MSILDDDETLFNETFSYDALIQYYAEQINDFGLISIRRDYNDEDGFYVEMTFLNHKTCKVNEDVFNKAYNKAISIKVDEIREKRQLQL